MKRLPLNQGLVEDRLLFIERSVQSLERFRSRSQAEFQSNPDNFRISYYDLYTALEACMDIGAHILSRIPGQKPKSYKDIPLLLAENKLMPEKFAADQLVKMAGYRNRMTHFYHRLETAEILEIIRAHLEDFGTFSRHIREILQDPARFGFPDIDRFADRHQETQNRKPKKKGL
jgi:uncharacterized protein YutE (UPF0331/DUF86 family)